MQSLDCPRRNRGNMEILYILIGFLFILNGASLWLIGGLKLRLGKYAPTNKPIPSLGNLTPEQIADRVINRMARAQLDPKASRYALDKVKNRFPDIIKTDEQADALITEAIKRAKKLKAG